jgi:hypothetical protein
MDGTEIEQEIWEIQELLRNKSQMARSYAHLLASITLSPQTEMLSILGSLIMSVLLLLRAILYRLPLIVFAFGLIKLRLN